MLITKTPFTDDIVFMFTSDAYETTKPLLSENEHGLKSYPIISSKELKQVAAILNNIVYTISPQGYIQHSITTENLPPRIVERCPVPDIYYLELVSLRYLAEQYFLKCHIQCNGIHSIITEQTVSIPAKYPAAFHYIVLLPPVTFLNYSYSYNDDYKTHIETKELIKSDPSKTFPIIPTDAYTVIKTECDKVVASIGRNKHNNEFSNVHR